MGIQVHFYTDGSCQHPESFTTRFASFAAAVDCTLSPEIRYHQADRFRATGTLPTSLQPLIFGRLPGDQRISRAELFAITYVCERFRNAMIHAGCAGAITAFHRCQAATTFLQLDHLEDCDLLQQLWISLQRGSQQAVKVAAHREQEDHLTPQELYKRLGNKMPNDLAISASWNLIPALAKDLQEVHAEHETCSAHLRELYGFIISSGHTRARLQAQANPAAHSGVDAARQRNQSAVVLHGQNWH